jgi:hypothetical protein
MSLTIKSNIDHIIEKAVAAALVAQSGQNDLRITVTPYEIPSGMGSITVPFFDTGVASKVSEGQNGTSAQIVSSGTVLNPTDSAFVKFVISDIASASAAQLAEVQGTIAGRRLQARYNQDIFGLFPSATLTTGGNGTLDISVEDVKKARRVLLEKDVVGPMYLVLTPYLWDKFEADLRTNYNIVLSDNSRDQILLGAGTVPVLGVNPIVVSSGIDEAGTITTAVYSREAIGWGYLQDLPIKSKIIEIDTGKNFILYSPYDVKIVNPNSIVKIVAKGV